MLYRTPASSSTLHFSDSRSKKKVESLHRTKGKALESISTICESYII